MGQNSMVNSPYKGMKKEEIIIINPNWKNCGFKKNNTLRKNKKDSLKTRKKKSIARIGDKNPMYGKKGELSPHFGKKRPEHSIFLQGRKYNNRTREKQRISAIKYIKETRGNISPNIGKDETRILNEIEKFINMKIERQHPILGYFMDGYLKKGNVVFEIDEIPNIKEKDMRREHEIKNNLNCTFIRIPTYKLKC